MGTYNIIEAWKGGDNRAGKRRTAPLIKKGGGSMKSTSLLELLNFVLANPGPRYFVKYHDRAWYLRIAR